MSEADQLVTDIASLARARSLTIVAAESLTAGTVAAALATGPGASDWFRGSIVAYQTATKHRLLGVTDERVITPRCAQEMAEGALRATEADVVVAITGVGGPEPEEGHPAGTVIICTGTRSDLRVYDHAIPGDPAEVVRSAATEALRHLKIALASM